jgi:hypothetical protein
MQCQQHDKVKPVIVSCTDGLVTASVLMTVITVNYWCQLPYILAAKRILISKE